MKFTVDIVVIAQTESCEECWSRVHDWSDKA